jgi:hypothetical protein
MSISPGGWSDACHWIATDASMVERLVRLLELRGSGDNALTTDEIMGLTRTE